jgi:hypothetical protein
MQLSVLQEQELELHVKEQHLLLQILQLHYYPLKLQVQVDDMYTDNRDFFKIWESRELDGRLVIFLQIIKKTFKKIHRMHSHLLQQTSSIPP